MNEKYVVFRIDVIQENDINIDSLTLDETWKKWERTYWNVWSLYTMNWWMRDSSLYDCWSDLQVHLDYIFNKIIFNQNQLKNYLKNKTILGTLSIISYEDKVFNFVLKEKLLAQLEKIWISINYSIYFLNT